MKKLLYLGFVAVAMCSCFLMDGKSSKQGGMSQEAYEEYSNVLESVKQIERQIDGAQALKVNREEALSLYEMCEELYYDYDPLGLDESTAAACEQLRQRTNNLRVQLLQLLENSVLTILTSVVDKNDWLIEETTTWPVYLKRGDSICVKIHTDKPSTLTIYNADARQTVKQFAQKTDFDCHIAIQNAAIYLVELNPNRASQYAEVYVGYTSANIDRLREGNITVTAETVSAQKGEWRATSVKGVNMQNLFDEPRKFTLRGQIKAAFSGSARALVAVQIPAGATDILYSLRISTNEGDKYSDGKFAAGMNTSYKKVKFLGLPLYESQKGSGLLATLLGENQPPREEDAYINMYVFYDAAQARKFQDGKPASELKYNIDYTTLGTQSCNGRIPAKGYRTIYLAFENERMRYNNYVWLEAVSAVPTTEYFKERYTIR